VTNDLPVRADGRRIPKIGAQLRAACDFMVYAAMSWDAAAVKAGLKVRGMRKALRRPHVLKYLRDERQVLLAAISTATPLRLAQLRDQDENRNAAVNAARTLEGLDADMPMRGGQATAPGFVLIFCEGGPAPTPVTIDGSRADDAPLSASESLVSQIARDEDR
jgi:hypothetical protein